MPKIDLNEREINMLSAALADRIRRFRKSGGEFDDAISEYEKLQQELDARFDRALVSETQTTDQTNRWHVAGAKPNK